MAFKIDFETESANSKIQALKKGVQDIATQANNAAKDLQSLVTAIDKSGTAYKNLKTKLKEARDVLKSLEEANKHAYEAGKKSSDQIRKQAKSYDQLDKSAATSMRAIRQATEVTKRSRRSMEEAAKMAVYWVRAQKLLGTQTSATDIAIKKQEAAVRLQVMTAEEYYAALRKSSSEQALLGEQLRLTDERLKGNSQLLLENKAAVKNSVGGYTQLRLELKKTANAYDLLHSSAHKTKVNSTKSVGLGALLGVQPKARIITDTEKAKTKVNALTRELAKLRQAYRQLSGDSKKAAKGISETGRASKVAAQRAAAFRAAMNAVGTHMGIFTGATVATAASVYGLISSFKAMVTIGAGFELQMVRANTIMGASDTQAKVLEGQVRALGESTVFTSTEVAGGLEALAMAGLNSVQALDALAPALQLAAIGQVDMYKSADILTNVMNGFRLTSEDIPAIVDDLATAVTSSNATITQMAGALSYVAPVAKAAGGSIEEVTAILEVFHNAGIKGSRAGTSLRRAYANLMKPSDDAKKVIEALGVVTKDSNGYMLEMSDIMRQLANSGAQTADIISLFGVRAAPAMLALLQDMKGVSSEFEVFRANLERNDGAAANMQKSLQNALGADARKLVSALQEKSNELFVELVAGFRSITTATTEFIKSVSPATIKKVADGLTAFGRGILFIVKAVYELTPLVLTAVGVTATLAAGMVTATAAITATTAAMTMYSTGATLSAIASKGLTAAVAASISAVRGLTVALVSNPLTAIAVAIAAAAAYFYTYSDSVDESTSAINGNTAAKKEAELAAQREKLQLEDLTKKYKEYREFAAFQVKNGNSSASFDSRDKQLKSELTQQTKKIAALKKIKKMAEDERVTSLADFTIKARNIDNITQLIADAEKRRAEIRAEYKKKQETGLDSQGIRNRDRADAKIAALQVKSLKDKLTEQSRIVTDKLAEVQASRTLSPVQVFLGSVKEVKSYGQKVRSAFSEEFNKIKEEQNNLKRDSYGNIIDQDKRVALAAKLVAVNKQLQEEDLKYAKTLRDVNSLLTDIYTSTDNAIASGETYVAKLKRENDSLRGVETSTKSLYIAKLELATVEAELAADALRSAGRDAEASAMQAKADKLGELIALTYNLEKANNRLKQNKSDSKSGDSLRNDFSKGKYLSDRLKADQEYAAAKIQLDKYMTEGLLKNQKDYNESLDALDLKRMESQHKVAFDLADSMSKMVGDNVAQAITMQQTWAETSANIKKAIVGGIIGALVQKGTAMAADALLTKVFAAQEVATTEGVAASKMASDAAVTTAKVVGEGVKATAVGATAATEASATEATATGTIAAMQTLMGVGVEMMAVFGPLSLAVSLATAGSNAIGATAGIAATTAAMVTAQLVTAAVGIATNVATSASGGTREIGGPVSAGQSYLVGERGAEVFTPTTSGAITSNADVKRSLSNGGTTVINNHYHDTTENTIYANDALSFQQQLTRSKGHLAALNRKENRRTAKS